MTVFYDARWKDEIVRLESDLEVERDRNQLLEQQVKLRNKAIETVAEMHKEAKPMYKLTRMVLDIAAGTPAQKAVEGRKQRRSSGFILDHYVDDLDQPLPTAEKQVEHDRRQARLNQHYGQLIKAMSRGSDFDQALRDEAPQGDPGDPSTPAGRLAYEREKREREQRERTKPRRHLYSG